MYGHGTQPASPACHSDINQTGDEIDKWKPDVVYEVRFVRQTSILSRKLEFEYWFA